MIVQTKLPGIENEIRFRVKNGKFKKDVARELGVSYYMVKKYTKDIRTSLRILKELEQRVREEVRNRKSKRQVATDLNISMDTVIKYTRDIKTKPIIKRKRSAEEIKQIRENVKKYNSKIETARRMGLTYQTVIWYTRGIPLRRKYAPKQRYSYEKIEEIRREVKNGKLKTQVAKEMNIPLSTVSEYTEDIYLVKKKADISNRAFLLLQELVCKGYAFPCSRYGFKDYQILRKEFPNIWRADMYGRTIFYLEDRSDIAMRMFLERIDRKIISYQELKQIIDIFQGNISKKDKKKYIKKDEN